MRDLRKVATILGGFMVAGGLVSAGLVGCSDDTSLASVDASVDQTADTSTNPPPPPPPPLDAGLDAPVDAPTLVQLPPAIADAICKRAATCCGALDAGAFDMGKCLTAYALTGWDNSLVGTGIPGVADGGHLVYDPLEGNRCVTRINNGGTAAAGKFTCGTMGAAELKAISTACFAAVRGDIPIGTAGCRASIECVPGAYCDATGGGVADGGGPGTCRALKAVGADCEDSPPLYEKFASDQCSYRGSGEGCYPVDGGPRKCTALRATGELCVAANEECQSGLCDDDGKCGTSVTYITPAFCIQYNP